MREDHVARLVFKAIPDPETWGLTSRAYLAREFYNGEVPGFELVDTPLPGDICADGSHVGIVSSRNTTISATETGVVENDWGFRLKDKKKSDFFVTKEQKNDKSQNKNILFCRNCYTVGGNSSGSVLVFPCGLCNFALFIFSGTGLLDQCHLWREGISFAFVL